MATNDVLMTPAVIEDIARVLAEQAVLSMEHCGRDALWIDSVRLVPDNNQANMTRIELDVCFM
jgi:hypothetical protein